MNIRFAKNSDLEKLNTIYNYEVVNGVATFDTDLQNSEGVQRWFFNHNQENHPIFVYEDNGIVLGYCSLSTYRSFDAFAKTVEISIYVDKDSRGFGIGRKLVSYAITYAQSRSDIRNITAVITSINKISINLFKSLGFINVGTHEACGCKFGKELGVTILYKLV
jgi:L-amino acid N-acyltransferase